MDEKNSLEKEFEYNGLTITRADYEGLPCPMAASLLSDAVMSNIVTEIYAELLLDWSKFEIDKYISKSCDEESEEIEMICDAFWRIMEKVAVDNGMKYYEDLDD